jgi:hypothetical protein
VSVSSYTVFRAGVVDVIIGLFLAAMESTIEASGVIALRMQIISHGGPAAQTEAELMVTEKMRAFAQALQILRTAHRRQRFAKTFDPQFALTIIASLLRPVISLDSLNCLVR